MQKKASKSGLPVAYSAGTNLKTRKKPARLARAVASDVPVKHLLLEVPKNPDPGHPDKYCFYEGPLNRVPTIDNMRICEAAPRWTIQRKASKRSEKAQSSNLEDIDRRRSRFLQRSLFASTEQRRVGSIFPKGRNYNGLSQSDPHPCIRIGRIGESKSIPYILILQNRIEPELIS